MIETSLSTKGELDRPSRLRRSMLVAACVALIGSAAGAQEKQPLRLVAFAGASNWPVWIGQKNGFFANENLDVTIEITPNSRQMASDVFGGKYDIALTSIDNVVSYVEGQGDLRLPGNVDFAAFMGVDDGMLALMGAPGTTSIGDLKGKDLSVDALTTGFAFVLRDALMKSGFKADEIRFTEVGGGLQRLAALREGKQSATLLNAPLDIVAENAGAVRLADMRELIGSYQGVCGMARRGWLDANREKAKAFVRSFHASVAWLTDPANKRDAIAILRERMANLETELVDRVYERLTDQRHGIKRDMAIDQEGFAKVLSLRSTYSSSGVTLSNPARYIDESIRKEALGVRQEQRSPTAK